jgi:CheY-like chemotaxis protein
VAQAVDGRGAVSRATAATQAGRPFDVVLMDLHMPELDGLAATRALRASGLRVPVVGLTATVLDDVRQQARDAGLDEVMAKPIDAAQLKALLAQLAQPAPAGAAPGPQA